MELFKHEGRARIGPAFSVKWREPGAPRKGLIFEPPRKDMEKPNLWMAKYLLVFSLCFVMIVLFVIVF
jgi:hypothetical protein